MPLPTAARRLALGLLGLTLAAFAGPPGPATAPRAAAAPETAADVTLKSVSYAQLGAAVKAQRGKVVVIDLWGEF
jgi:hypothetical protein